MSQIYDVIILGRGVAGLASAIHLLCSQSGLTIALIGAQPKFRQPQGETLAASAEQELKMLGVWSDFCKKKFPIISQTFSNWGTKKLIPTTYNALSKLGWQVDRDVFYHCFEKKIKKISGQYLCSIMEPILQLKKDNSYWNVITKNTAVMGRILIDCSGRRHVSFRQTSKKNNIDKLCCSYAYLSLNSGIVTPTPGVLIEPVKNGWWYSTLLPNQTMALSYFTDSNLLPKKIGSDIQSIQKILAASNYTRRRIESGGFDWLSTPKICQASTSRLQRFAGNNWLAVGDSAMTLDPLSSHGITTALWSARKAAETILKQNIHLTPFCSDSYHQEMELAFENFLLQKNAIYQMENEFPENIFWKNRRL
ncbi:NAD(P)/FAD-dependent oxidoreductase [Pelagibaculum spongiae]|uniref:FAD-binding domain-containing protein n=1 Tax=Pelagibaculum spongiae TaxID=2080658 RepID=A0A2V1H2W0_9GAMM|nr:tryptophan 7-halogenase [Pelagibaculum spongiae]PVZ71507.1 hypothetical protein DC094_00195 [Pelagibaculum spongiae]